MEGDKELLLITAASGKQSSHLIPHILKRWKHIRLQVASSSSKDRLQKLYAEHENVEVVQADMASQADCHRIMAGVTTCFLITPGFHANETSCGINIIDAAVAQTPGRQPKHLLYSSVLHPHLRKLLNHDAKRYVEEHLIESGLPYTIVQPTTMMENLPLPKLLQQDVPTYTALWSPETKFSFVSCRDIGEACANILFSPARHVFATYQLVSTSAPLSYREALQIVSAHVGREVRVEQKPIEEGVKAFNRMRMHGEPGEVAFNSSQGPARMFMYYNEKGLVGNPNMLGWLLGRKPLEYEDWVRFCVEGR
ncbi:NAD(P)-binding protein [Hortaea werneckii]|nr:NAD(P)-binding protein [Hortaea werneckii]KAI7535783.1 NAD(P)-binding protein [Hortaea werneckii]